MSVYYKNIPNIEDTDEDTGPSGNNGGLWGLDKTLPLYFVEHNSTIELFDQLTYNKDTIDKLNQLGLNIYLDEPLVSYNAKRQDWDNVSMFSEFIGNEDPVDLRAKELDSIEKLISTNKLTNVTVHTCDYDVVKYYPHYSNKMKLRTNDRFVKRRFRPKYHKVMSLSPLTKKFINLNWRYVAHRHLIASYLNEKSSYISWPHKKSIDFLKKPLWVNNSELLDRITKKTNTLYKQSPKTLDIPMRTPLPDLPEQGLKASDQDSAGYPRYAPHDIEPYSELLGSILRMLFENSFVVVVSESRFAQPTANFSEKTLKAIIHHKPFILVAPPHTLKYMREEFGFKTFSDFWDESYDEEEIHSERMKKIFDIIDDIENKPLKELEEIYTQMKEIIKYNFNIVNQNHEDD